MMKLITILSFTAAVEAAALHRLEKRQTEPGAGLLQSVIASASKPPRQAVKTTKLQPVLFQNAVRERITWGPFTLNPANGEHKQGGLKLDKQSDIIEGNLAGMCKECMVLQARTDITDKDGNRMGLDKDIYVHHLILADIGEGKGIKVSPLVAEKSNCTSTGSGGMPPMGKMGTPKPAGEMTGHSHSKRQTPSSLGMNSFNLFIAKGNEGDSTIFGAVNSTTIKSGYWIGKDDRFASASEVVNYKTVPQDVYVSIDMEYISVNGPRPADYLDVESGTIRVENCGSGINLFPPKDRAITYKSTDRIVRHAGYLVGLTPHMHDGGLNMKVFVNDKLACHADAIYGSDGGTNINGQKWETITAYSPCTEEIKLSVGDRVKITSDYDLRQHKLRPDSVDHNAEAEAMAIALFQYAISK